MSIHRARQRRLTMRTILALMCSMSLSPAQSFDPTPTSLEPFLRLALNCLHREYPNKIAHVLNGDGDARPPRELSPIFFGCFDWHSSVHGHWLLVRSLRLDPSAVWAAEVRAALARSFTAERAAGELRYLEVPGRESFERPYGWAWSFQLQQELREWNDPDASVWAAALAPMEDLFAARVKSFFPKLTHPVRTGEHSQTAFALGLILDWARSRADASLVALLEERARTYYGNDRGYRLAFEPGGQDFLSPGLAEADLMRRILNPAEFAAWLGAFLPEWPLDGSVLLPPAVPRDRSDGKLVHLDGLNLSRAWMLEGIVRGLPSGDPRRRSGERSASEHRAAGLAALGGQHYEGGHWLGSFATYLVTERGLR